MSAGKRPGCLTLPHLSPKVGDVISRDFIFVDCQRALPGVQCVIESWSEMQACTLKVGTPLGGTWKHLARSSQLPKASGKLLETSQARSKAIVELGTARGLDLHPALALPPARPRALRGPGDTRGTEAG